MIEQTARIDPEGSSYREYTQDHRYSHDTGLVVLPVAGPTPAHRVIRLHGGFGLRRVAWKAARAGSPPMIPAAADGPNDTLLSSVVIPSLPIPNDAKQGYDWRVQGEYVYVQNAPRVAGQDAFGAGEYPYLVLPQAPQADALVGAYVPAIFANPTITNKLEAISEYAVGVAQVSDSGFVTWPFTVLPAAASSTHIIGG